MNSKEIQYVKIPMLMKGLEKKSYQVFVKNLKGKTLTFDVHDDLTIE